MITIHHIHKYSTFYKIFQKICFDIWTPNSIRACTFLLVPDFMVRRTLVRDTWCPTTCCFMIHMCSYVQVRPHGQPAECIKELLRLVKKFPDGFFMHTTAFFNAALRGAFARRSTKSPASYFCKIISFIRTHLCRSWIFCGEKEWCVC